MQKAIILFFVLVILSGIALGQIPQLINYQALLLDPATSQPVPDGTYTIVFSIYDVPGGGSAIWDETHAVETKNGLYSVMLGSVIPLESPILNGSEKYLGITVGGDPEMIPRKRIVSVAYAILSEDAAKLEGRHASEFAEADHDHDSRYYTKTELNTSDGNPPNLGSNRLSWDNLTDMPTGFADGIDNVGAGGGGWIDDGAVVRLETATDNVGIGTSNPDGNKLNVAGGSSPAIEASSSGSNAINAYANSGGGFAAGNFTASGEGTYGIRAQSDNYDALYAHSGTGYAINASSSGSTVIRSNGIVHATAGGFRFPDGTTQTTAATAGTPAWYLSGNNGTTPGTNFVGTTDNKNLILKVNNASALRLEPNPASPNIIGGYGGNIVTTGVKGATISGGGETNSLHNRVTDDYGTIGGGAANLVGNDAGTTYDNTYATVGGGTFNRAKGSFSTVAGGNTNRGDGHYAAIGGGTDNEVGGYGGTIGGGISNTTSSNYYETIGGGNDNETGNTSATIGGGYNNIASGHTATIAGGAGNQAAANYSTIGGGSENQATYQHATVGGGYHNYAHNNAAVVSGGAANEASGNRSTVCGGYLNVATGHAAMVLGGESNTAQGSYSFAAGRRAKAYNNGAFVWADNADSVEDFASTIDNEFKIRASGGMDVLSKSPYYGAHIDNRDGGGDGLRAEANVSEGNIWGAIYAVNYGTSPAIYGFGFGGPAGYFNGNVTVTGTLSKGGGGFKIDHPLNPENRYLSHSFVESPDMKNVYDGVVLLDARGEAWVDLPEWFEALNRDFRYQLTCIGCFAQVYIAEEISNNRFKIAGGAPGTKISWQVTGIRQDAFANAHRIPVEEEKSGDERGKYLHPKEHGVSETMGIGYEARLEKERK